MKNLIKKILKENEAIPKDLIPRKIKIIDINKIIVLIGARRVGKSYMLFNKIAELKKKRRPFLFLNFEDERLLNFKAENCQLILDAYFEMYPENINKVVHLFFDEIQSLENFELFIKRVYERKKYKIFLTGSSSKVLSKEIATSLRGRAYPVYIYPLSFKEFLEFKKIKLKKNFEYSEQRHLISAEFENYLKFGSYPEIVTSTKKKDLLKIYLDLMIYKDLIERYKIRNIKLLKTLLRFLITNISSNFSYNSVYKFLKQELNISRDTIIEYVGYLNEIAFVFLINKFNYSLKFQELSLKKSYILDNGFFYSSSFAFSENYGKLLENIVFLELKRKGYEIYYHKEKKECDFLIKEKDKITFAIQVSQTLKNDKTKKREIAGLIEACQNYNLKEGFILTLDEEDEFEKNKIKIITKPVWKWLL